MSSTVFVSCSTSSSSTSNKSSDPGFSSKELSLCVCKFVHATHWHAGPHFLSYFTHLQQRLPKPVLHLQPTNAKSNCACTFEAFSETSQTTSILLPSRLQPEVVSAVK